MENFINDLLLFIVIAMLISLVVVAIIIYLVLRGIRNYTSPNVVEMQQTFARLKAGNPGASTEDLIEKIIHQESIKCGIVGAIAGLGGFFTLPITLPIDLLVSLRIQAALVEFIATMYGKTDLNDTEAKIRTSLIISGGVKVSETSFDLIMKLVLRVIGESLSMIVPLIGVGVGFAVNYFIARASGDLALRWYSGKLHAPAMSLPKGS
ncbi:MAG: hypothetical protein ABI947_08005 [Chloroflexota bacterium]